MKEWDKMAEEEYFSFTRAWVGSCKEFLKIMVIYISCTQHNLGELMTVLRLLNFKINNVINLA